MEEALRADLRQTSAVTSTCPAALTGSRRVMTLAWSGRLSRICAGGNRTLCRWPISTRRLLIDTPNERKRLRSVLATRGDTSTSHRDVCARRRRVALCRARTGHARLPSASCWQSIALTEKRRKTPQDRLPGTAKIACCSRSVELCWSRQIVDCDGAGTRRNLMNGLIYLVGLIVVILAVLSFFGLR